MPLTELTAISPIDGRYAYKTRHLTDYFSEYGVIKMRLLVELKWLQYLHPSLNSASIFLLDQLYEKFDENEARVVKRYEQDTNHDIKAIEYYLREKIELIDELKFLSPWIHFGCTSDDTSNLAYGLILSHTRLNILLPQLDTLLSTLKSLAKDFASNAMLGRTHGQLASPTTIGKELANVASRLLKQIKQLRAAQFYGKMNGAVGNFNAHCFALPEKDWLSISRQFVESLGLVYQRNTTQIEPRDYIAELSHQIIRINSILIDFCRDIWGYIAIGYIGLKVHNNEIGSSTMPHKVNPIDFENAEGNLYIANALFNCFAEKLPISRWQRDLVDSTIQRNLGIAIGHAVIAYQGILKGLGKIKINEEKMISELNQHWEVLSEPVQMLLRVNNYADGYEKLKLLTFNRSQICQKDLQDFIKILNLSDELTAKINSLTPTNYLGYAIDLAQEIE